MTAETFFRINRQTLFSKHMTVTSLAAYIYWVSSLPDEISQKRLTNVVNVLQRISYNDLCIYIYKSKLVANATKNLIHYHTEDIASISDEICTILSLRV